MTSTQALDTQPVTMQYVTMQAPKPQFPLAEIKQRPCFAHVQVDLKQGEAMCADAGTMLWMDGDLKMDTNCRGGFCDSYWRTCARESFCQNSYSGPGSIAFGFDLPGDILPFGTTKQDGWILSSGAFICGSPNTRVGAKWGGCGVCMCTREGPFLTHITSYDESPALFYAGGYGAIMKHDVPAGKNFLISSGLFFGCSDKVKIDISLAAGLITCLCGGHGFMMKFKGPCSVWTQNRDEDIFNALLNPKPPAPPGKDDNGAAVAVSA